jgi:Ser/Thr protein kinase RdoA (MazF antagonist)
MAADKGGDIDLTRMPAELVRACRQAWRVLGKEPHAVVHGDLSPGNILVDETGGLVLIDWDEARVDAIAFDDVELLSASGAEDPMRLAVLAWEVACSWSVEPDYAMRLSHDFLAARSTISQDP